MTLTLLLALACGPSPQPPGPLPSPGAASPSPTSAVDAVPPPREAPHTVDARRRMVEQQLAARDITDPAVLAAMRAVPRHRFMPEASWSVAYHDGPAAIGWGQTISQPYIVAFMTQALSVQPGMKVLEVGTGSGYQAAVLSALGAQVYSVEIVPELAAWADGALRAADFPVVASDQGPAAPTPPGLGPIHLRTGDGYLGWPEAAPFDRIILTAAPDHVPPPLRDQLAVGGLLLLPLGGEAEVQELVRLERGARGWREERLLPVRFVPMTGQAQQP